VAVRGEWTVDGSAADLRLLSGRLRATGQSGLKRNIGAAVRAATVPCRAAVRAEIRAVMPHGGGLNEWLAKSSINSAVLTGPASAGVVVRASKRGHDIRSVNRTGKVRHPTRAGRGWKYENREKWRFTEVPDHWFEHALEPFGPIVAEALRVAQNAAAREAGFRLSAAGTVLALRSGRTPL
jgi:hypothetical protein